MVKVATTGDGRGADRPNEFAKFREDMQGMFTHLDQQISSRIQKLDVKFFTIFEEFWKDLDSIKQDANQTKKDLSKVAKDVEVLEKGLEFQPEIISKHKGEQEDNLTRLQNEVDAKIKELNEKLLL